MFKDKRFLAIFIVQTVTPWAIALLGIFDVYFWNMSSQYYREKLMDECERANMLFDKIYRITMVYGLVLLLAIFVTGIVAFVIMLINFIRKNNMREYSVARPLVIWLYSGGCMLGTLILMFLVIAFTVGQSV